MKNKPRHKISTIPAKLNILQIIPHGIPTTKFYLELLTFLGEKKASE